MALLMEPLNSASPKVKELHHAFIQDKQMAFLWKVLCRNLKIKHGSIENIERNYIKGGYQGQCDEVLKLWAFSNEDTPEESKTFLEIIRTLHIGRTTKTEISRRQDLLGRLGETIERVVGLSSGDS